MSVFELKGERKRFNHFIRAIKWCISVLLILFLPYFFSAYVGYFIEQVTLNKIGGLEILFNIIESDLLNRRFIFIPISLASASYIDYLFEEKLKRKEALIHISFFVILLMVMGLFICVYIAKDIIDNSSILGLDLVNTGFMTRIYFYLSLVYAIGVKYVIISYRSGS